MFFQLHVSYSDSLIIGQSTCMPNTFVCVYFDLFLEIGFFIVYCNPKVSCFSLFNLIEFIEAYTSFEEKLEASEGEFEQDEP